jgi:hypothetical protein
LLTDDRIDPDVENGYPMKVAMKEKHVAVIEVLSRDPRVTLTGEERDEVTKMING